MVRETREKRDMREEGTIQVSITWGEERHIAVICGTLLDGPCLRTPGHTLPTEIVATGYSSQRHTVEMKLW